MLMVPADSTTAAAGASVGFGALVGALLEVLLEELGTSVGAGPLLEDTGGEVADEPQATSKAATNRTIAWGQKRIYFFREPILGTLDSPLLRNTDRSFSCIERGRLGKPENLGSQPYVYKPRYSFCQYQWSIDIKFSLRTEM